MKIRKQRLEMSNSAKSSWDNRKEWSVNGKTILNREKKTESVHLLTKPSTIAGLKEKARSCGVSTNEYINNLLETDIRKN